MMALADILAARAASARASGTVEVGALGAVTVEALPIRELERLSRGADGERAVFYAACRELQSVGAALLREGKVYRPDEVTALLSDAEAARAAEAVRALSGWTGGQVSRETENAQIRPALVQEKAEVRPDAVREKTTESAEIRHRSVQEADTGGQASGEFSAEYDEALPSDGKTQALPEKTPDIPQNVGVSDNSDGSLRNMVPHFGAKKGERGSGEADGLHEGKSEIGGQGRGALHEIKSEYAPELHEMKSETARKGRGALHETASESTETLHETESELAERLARELLDGLRRAAWVR